MLGFAPRETEGLFCVRVTDALIPVPKVVAIGQRNRVGEAPNNVMFSNVSQCYLCSP